MSIREVLSDADLFKIAEKADGTALVDVMVGRIAQLSHDLGVARQQAFQANSGGQQVFARVQQLEHENAALRHRIEQLKREVEEQRATIQAQIELEEEQHDDPEF